MTAPTDPLFINQTHLSNTTGGIDINILAAWADYTGEGVTVAIIDDGFDLTHQDLTGRFNTTLSYDYFANDAFPQAEPGNNHGTAVAGILGAARNGAGVVGVAYEATLVGLRISFTATEDTATIFDHALARMAEFDVVNNSWGFTTPFSDPFDVPEMANTYAALINAVSNGRDGLGTTVVFAGGNLKGYGDNTNYHNISATPFAITVGALNTDGEPSQFSNPGASILVSAPGQSVLTTDGSGSLGYFSTDYVSLNGTSAATPIVSGIIALMLEANPALGYRDIQEILVLSARQIGDAGWQTNGAGLHFSHTAGFGAVDAHAAVRLAETWQSQHTYANLTTMTQAYAGETVAITDDATPVTSSITVSDDLRLDHVQVTLDIAHIDTSQLTVTLISPAGTRSVLTQNAPYGDEFPTFTFMTVANWNEHAAGTWTLEIVDGVSGTTGTLDGWSITLLGDVITPDDLYTYTDDNAGLLRVTDTNDGVDTINAAARTNALSIDLAQQTGVENLYTGDGNDYIRGSALDNAINAGRGNDVIVASLGHDVIDGGAGSDTYTSLQAFNHTVTINGANDITLTSLTNSSVTRLINIETYQFAGRSYDLAQLTAASRSGELIDVVYFVHGDAGVAGRHSNTNSSDAYTAEQLGVGGEGHVLLADRDDNHLTLTNNAGNTLDGLSLRMDDGMNLTLRGFAEVTVIADGTRTTTVEIEGGQQGFIQTGAGNDSVGFLAFLIDQDIPEQDRTLTASTGAGDDRVTITDRSAYLAFDIDLGEGNDYFYVAGALNGTVHGGRGADIFAFGASTGEATVIDDFSALDDRLDLSELVEAHAGDDPVTAFVTLNVSGEDTIVSVDGHAVATLTGTALTEDLQHYIDVGVILVNPPVID